MEYAEWLEMEREILARDRAAFVGGRPLAGWEIDGRKNAMVQELDDDVAAELGAWILSGGDATWENLARIARNARETH